MFLGGRDDMKAAITSNIRVFFAQMDIVAIIYTSPMLILEIYCKNIYAVDLHEPNDVIIGASSESVRA